MYKTKDKTQTKTEADWDLKADLTKTEITMVNHEDLQRFGGQLENTQLTWKNSRRETVEDRI